MTDITVYSKGWCPYCAAARALLEQKGVAFDVIDIGDEPQRRDEMLERSGGRRTVPQIFIGDTHVGGYDDLEAMNRAGDLDPMLHALSAGNSTENQGHTT